MNGEMAKAVAPFILMKKGSRKIGVTASISFH